MESPTQIQLYLGLNKPVVDTDLSFRSFSETEAQPAISHPKAEEIWARASKSFSIEASRQGEKVALCLLRFVQGNFVEILHIEGKNKEAQHGTISTVLATLWEAEYSRVFCEDVRSFEILEGVGFEAVTRSTSHAFFGQAQALVNQGRFQDAKSPYEGDIPENVSFLLSWQSKNQLYWLDLSKWNPKHQQQGTPLNRRAILAAAPLAFHAFGDINWLEDFLRRAMVGLTVGHIESDQVKAACFVGKANTYPCISSICVLPELREKGLAAALLTHSLTLLKQSGEQVVLAHIRESNLASKALFERSGFTKVNDMTELLKFGKAAGYLRRETATYLPLYSGLGIEEACTQAELKLVP